VSEYCRRVGHRSSKNEHDANLPPVKTLRSWTFVNPNDGESWTFRQLTRGSLHEPLFPADSLTLWQRDRYQYGKYLVDQSELNSSGFERGYVSISRLAIPYEGHVQRNVIETKTWKVSFRSGPAKLGISDEPLSFLLTANVFFSVVIMSLIKNKCTRAKVFQKQKKAKSQKKLNNRLAQAKAEANDPVAKKVCLFRHSFLISTVR
jgi:hypothetical protein